MTDWLSCCKNVNFFISDQINGVKHRKYVPLDKNCYLHLSLLGSSDFQQYPNNIYFPSHSYSVSPTSHLLMQSNVSQQTKQPSCNGK